MFKFSLMQKKNPRYFIFNSQGYTNATAAPLTSVIVEGCQKFSAYLDTVMCQENLTIFFRAAWKCFNLLYLKLSVSQPETFACLSSKGCKTIPDRNLTPLDFLSFVQSKWTQISDTDNKNTNQWQWQQKLLGLWPVYTQTLLRIQKLKIKLLI